ncbi:hypothetical protein Tco_0227553 [Tanacetum coccineum]
MSNYLKHQGSWTSAQLKKLSDEEIKAKYERLVRSIANFVPMGAEERVKRLGPELQSDTSKKQKTTEVKEVPVTEEPVKEPTAPKQEEIEQPIKKSGRQKSMARKRKLGQSMARKRKLGQSTAKEMKILVEKKYPLMKKVLLQMLELKLESEDDSTMVQQLCLLEMPSKSIPPPHDNCASWQSITAFNLSLSEKVEDCQGVMATCDMGEVVEVEERFYPGVILRLQGKRMER